ncbi:hypothetical protein QUF80_08040 [Desulfococcaceae bacterium HSG8]|nr:hypothetical protein [Desulfococcaceae bacterium HSG8]
MIKLESRPPVPDSLKSEKVKRIKNKISDKIQAGECLKSVDFEPYWRENDVKTSLWRYHHKKCCYCERKRDLKRESDVEHFRPKAKVTEDENHSGYWWLAYDWTNYLFSCKACNQEYKKNRFPLLPGGKRAFKERDDLSVEKPVLINPIDEIPEKFIGFDWQGSYGILVKAVGLDKAGRGHQTVNRLTAINDQNVMRQRAELVSLLQAIASIMISAKHCDNQTLISEYSEIIKTETSANKEFAGFRRAFFRALGL